MTIPTPPPTPRDRERALDRLRSVTVGVAVGGIAASVGFGALSAATFAGQPGATTVQDLTVAPSPPAVNGGSGGAAGEPGTQGDPGTQANPGNGADPFGGGAIPFTPPQRAPGGGFGGGHLSTGGSG